METDDLWGLGTVISETGIFEDNWHLKYNRAIVGPPQSTPPILFGIPQPTSTATPKTLHNLLQINPESTTISQHKTSSISLSSHLLDTSNCYFIFLFPKFFVVMG
jgi:hypothetical protein